MSESSTNHTRREVLKATAVIAGAAMTNAFIARSAYAATGDTIKIGLIGCGGRGSAAAKQALSTEGPVELVAVCDREPIMAEQLAVRFGVPRQYVDVDEMLRNHSIDVVHITTPPQSHLSLALKAFEAGAHVLVEKPVAPTLIW